MLRLDQALVAWGLAPSRTKAQEMIRSGEIEIENSGQWSVCLDVSKSVDPGEKDRFRVGSAATTLQYVSRGGHKLAAALDYLQLSVAGLKCLDVGQSTGGFSDALLQRGVAHVIGVDVGSGQLHPKLSQDPRVQPHEQTHIEEFFAKLASPLLVDLCVVDVSFISLTKVLPILGFNFKPGVRLLALVKPQFEVGPQALGKGGVVKDARLFDIVKEQIKVAAHQSSFRNDAYFASAVKGQDGNQEFFLLATRT